MLTDIDPCRKFKKKEKVSHHLIKSVRWLETHKDLPILVAVNLVQNNHLQPKEKSNIIITRYHAKTKIRTHMNMIMTM